MLGLSDSVRSTGYVSQDNFAYYLAASDVCLNLRYPTAGETSASLLRIMGAGVPVLVSRTGAFEELPDDAVGKIDVDDTEEELLLEYLLLLARRPDLRVAMSSAARRYVAQHHTLAQAVRGYLEFLLSLKGRQAEISIPAHIPPTTDDRRPTVATALPINPKIANPKSKMDSEVLTILADAAAELDIEATDDLVLNGIADKIAGLLPTDGDLGTG
jgi:hypothetical protein